jgi:hypothetical protein
MQTHGGRTSVHSKLHLRSATEAHQTRASQRSSLSEQYKRLCEALQTLQQTRGEAPPPTDDAAARTTRPRFTQYRVKWPSHAHAPPGHAHDDSCPEGNHSILPQRRTEIRQPHKGKRLVLCVGCIKHPAKPDQSRGISRA